MAWTVPNTGSIALPEQQAGCPNALVLHNFILRGFQLVAPVSGKILTIGDVGENTAYVSEAWRDVTDTDTYEIVGGDDTYDIYLGLTRTGVAPGVTGFTWDFYEATVVVTALPVEYDDKVWLGRVTVSGGDATLVDGYQALSVATYPYFDNTAITAKDNTGAVDKPCEFDFGGTDLVFPSFHLHAGPITIVVAGTTLASCANKVIVCNFGGAANTTYTGYIRALAESVVPMARPGQIVLGTTGAFPHCANWNHGIVERQLRVCASGLKFTWDGTLLNWNDITIIIDDTEYTIVAGATAIPAPPKNIYLHYVPGGGATAISASDSFITDRNYIYLGQVRNAYSRRMNLLYGIENGPIDTGWLEYGVTPSAAHVLGRVPDLAYVEGADDPAPTTGIYQVHANVSTTTVEPYISGGFPFTHWRARVW